MIRVRQTLLFAIAGLALTACVSFGGKPPKTLLTLTPDTTLAAGETRTGVEGQTLVVLSPGAPSILLNNRVAVRSNGNDVAYLKDAAWADTPPHLFASLLAETIAARTKLVVIDRRQYSAAPGARLSGQLADFSWDASARKAVVRYDAAFMPGEGKPLLTRRFEATAPAASGDTDTVVRALNTAANQVAADVAEWVGR